jgi:dipeptidyl aminopeptidase/acylaminoacyl peptidase
MQTSKRWERLMMAALFVVTTAQAAPPRAEIFFKEPDIGSAVLSPSGKQLAITTGHNGGRIALSVYDIDTGTHAIAAQFSDVDITRVRWVNDKRLVFSVVDSSTGSGRYSDAPGIFAISADGNEMRQLVRRKVRSFVSDQFGRTNRLLDWNHILLRVPDPRPGKPNEEILIAQLAENGSGHQLPLWLNTRTGFTRSVDVSVPRNTVGWLADPFGELLVAFTHSNGRHGALYRTPGSKDWQQLYESGQFDAPFIPETVDGKGQLFVSQPRGEAGERALYRYDFAKRAPEPEPVVSTPGYDFDGAVLTDTDGRTIGVRVLLDGDTTVWFDANLKALQAQTDKLLPGRTNTISCRRCAAEDVVAVLRSNSDRDPGQYWIYQAKPAAGEKSWRAIGPARSDIKPADMAELDLHRITARDGLNLPVWVTKAVGKKGPQPAVVLVHGGPWGRGGEWRWNAEAQFLASRGYVVIEPEFRGSTGFGDAHFRAGFRQWGQSMQDDVADALKWAQAQGIESDKACIVGASYGGYSTLMGLVKHPELYRCGVAFAAVTDLDLYATGSWLVSDDISNDAREFSIPELVGDPQKDAAMFAANSPVKQAARIKAPLLLAFGEDDRRVPLEHGERMRKALIAAGNAPEWITYAAEGRALINPKNRVDFAKRMAAFLDRHLQ